ncbi:putative iron-dependent peroxidase [Microbacteriaceae bacterium SG_E_30_P1]|uniref:Iron-dependent peroxidase n=1 Tax=Antiquaquibacter oligotrophicus TaxID=2880260 RepID=A0ABT6KSA4_9MICO|nr:Dyp-type peroxidase [Antiquaquibacter oligotrophicus]MDH6182072.1 putative iron-dependent peroxidase [Antiquaquibacter oligotrophicus]UDF12261.1 Dyp-type peroxidase [Antiquaquibacter oligotrophicus]
MTSESAWARTPIQPQSVDAPLSRSAVFLTLTLSGHPDAAARARSVLGDLGGLVRAVGFRDLGAHLSCVAAIGSEVWDAVTGLPRPVQLHPFPAVVGPAHTAPSTPGDLFFHIRAERDDFCFELERLILDKLGNAVQVADETVGFRYFDSRDLLGFVDGTENPTGSGMREWALVADGDPDHAGGSYVVVQKYLHDLAAWNALSTETQEKIIGRTKADNVELDDLPRKSHKDLATIVDDDGVEHDILRDNMPFGRPGAGEFGTYFIGYSKDVWVTERMISAMFLGDPPGSYDRILDVSHAVTGATFFAPSNDVLESFGD